MRPPRSAAPLLGLTLGGAALRLAGIGLSGLWLDEAFEAAAASSPLGRNICFESNHPPLHRVLLALWVRLAGDSDVAVRIPAALFGILTVPALFVLVDRVASRRAAWLAALLAAVSPYLVFYSREARAYSLLALFAVLSTIAWLAWTRDDRPRARLAWAVLAVLGLHAHYFFAFVLLAQAADLLGRPDRARRIREALLPAGAVLLACLPWTAYAATHLAPQDRSYVVSPLGNVPGTLFRFAVGYGLYVLDSTSAAAPIGAQVAAALPAAALALASFGPALVLGVRAAWRDRERGGRLLALTLALPFPVLLTLAPAIPLLHDRYLAFAAPAFLAIAAIGAASLRPRVGVLAAALLVAVSLAGDARDLLDPRCRKEDWRAAATTIEDRERPGDAVLLDRDHVHWAFDRYYRGRLPVRRLESDPAAALGDLRPARIWLVLSHLPVGETSRVLLDRSWRAREEWAFPRHWGIRIVLLEPAATDPPRIEGPR